jgi:ketosteroid isomerase-like protein
MKLNAHIEVTSGTRRSPWKRAAGRLLLLIMACVFAFAASTDARIVKNGDGEGADDPHRVFDKIAEAWQNADQQTLADLVHEDGLKVTTGGDPDRTTHYSRSQAFYYFKNVFQTHRSLVFSFELMPDVTAGDRVHGMAVWKRRRPDSDRIQELKLVCLLARQGDQWRLVEINKIR